MAPKARAVVQPARAASSRPTSPQSDAAGPSHNVNMSSSDLESDHSQAGNVAQGKGKRKRRAPAEEAPQKQFYLSRRGHTNRTPLPVPELTDEEDFHNTESDEQDEGALSFKRRERKAEPEPAPAHPQVLRIVCEGNHKGFNTFNIDATVLTSHFASGKNKIPPIVLAGTPQTADPIKVDDSDDTITDDEQSDIDMGDTETDKKQNVDLKDTKTKDKQPESDVAPTGFLDLPLELRTRIYRQVFRGDRPVDFEDRTDFSRSAAFLRTCKDVSVEGRAILYGENSFHFARTPEMRGAYWQQTWKEVAYKDVRRFLQTIGPHNVALIKYVSFMLTDGVPVNNRGTDLFGRKYVNDATLQHVFRLLGAHATLNELGISFAGRAQVLGSDFHFLDALIEIRCHKLTVFGHHHFRENKILPNVLARLRSFMEMKSEDPDAHDPNQSVYKPDMLYTRTTPVFGPQLVFF